MKDVVALVLAGGRIGGFDVLTQNRAKSALPFGGTYRIIDFCLSSLAHSNIDKVGLIIQYLPASLIEHVGIGQPWDFHGYGRIFKIMPPFVGMGKIEWFKGTADALNKNLNFVYEYEPRDILVLCGDHVYNMDFKPIIEYHRKQNADMTIVGRRGKPEDLSKKYGYFEKDEGGKIKLFHEKPLNPPTDLYSLGIYVFKTEMLLNWLSENNSLPEDAKTNVLAYDIVQKKATAANCYGYEFDGYWNYLEDINVYYLAHLEMLREKNPLKVSTWNVLTNLEDRNLSERTPLYSGKNSKIKRSLIAAGCSIDGIVENSVLSPGVIVEEGAIVSNSIIFHDCVIKKGTILNRVIADKDCFFDENCQIGESAAIPEVEFEKNTKAGEKSFRIIPDQKLTIIGKDVKTGKGIVIKSSCVISPGTDLTLMYGTVFERGKKINQKGVEE